MSAAALRWVLKEGSADEREERIAAVVVVEVCDEQEVERQQD